MYPVLLPACQHVPARLFILCLLSSPRLQIGLTCYDMNYEALPAQMKAAKLDVLHNFW